MNLGVVFLLVELLLPELELPPLGFGCDDGFCLSAVKCLVAILFLE